MKRGGSRGQFGGSLWLDLIVLYKSRNKNNNKNNSNNNNNENNEK